MICNNNSLIYIFILIFLILKIILIFLYIYFKFDSKQESYVAFPDIPKNAYYKDSKNYYNNYKIIDGISGTNWIL